MFKILVIEDEKITNDLLTHNLKQFGYDVYQSFDGKNAIATLERIKFHLVITDIVMPGKDGYQVMDYIKNQNLNIPIVISSAMNSELDQLKGYNYQIEDYITKPFNVEIVVKKINIILKRLYNYSQETELIYDEHVLVVGGEHITFSSKEFEVLEYLFSNKLKYCSKEDIYDYVWEDEDTSLRVVDYTVKRIRKKLGEHSTFIKTKVGVGYKYEE